MIHWAWLILAGFVGVAIGVVITCLAVSAYDRDKRFAN